MARDEAEFNNLIRSILTDEYNDTTLFLSMSAFNDRDIARLFDALRKSPRVAKRITSLFLAFNHIRLPPDLQYLPNLEVVDLSNNQLIYPPYLKGCRKLTEVYLNDNQMLTIPDITHKHRIKFLYMRDNPLTDASKIMAFILCIPSRNGHKIDISYDRMAPNGLELTLELIDDHVRQMYIQVFQQDYYRKNFLTDKENYDEHMLNGTLVLKKKLSPHDHKHIFEIVKKYLDPQTKPADIMRANLKMFSEVAKKLPLFVERLTDYTTTRMPMILGKAEILTTKIKRVYFFRQALDKRILPALAQFKHNQENMEVNPENAVQVYKQYLKPRNRA